MNQARSRRPSAATFMICPNIVLGFACVLSLALLPLLEASAVLALAVSGGILLLRRPSEAARELARFWWIHTIPVWCIATVFWSNYPDLTARHGVQLWLTFIVAITLASRISAFNLLRIVCSAYAVACLISLAVNEVRADGSWIGLFGSKNEFAGAASVFVLSSLALLIDRSVGSVWRLGAAAFIGLGLFLLIKAQSAGALITTIAAMGVGATLSLMSPLTPRQRLAALFILALAGGTVAVALLANLSQFFALILDLTNKDATLTGRTDLWEIALAEIRRYPLFGQGFQAFWVHGNAIAEDIWMMFYIESRSGFHFHNTYLSNAVEIGLIGAALQGGAFLAACGLCLFWVLRDPRAESIFFSIFLVRQFILSFGEVVFYSQFSIVTVLSVASLVYGVRALFPDGRAREFRRAPTRYPRVG